MLWATQTLFPLPQEKKVESISIHGVGVSSYMTDLSDNQASKKTAEPKGGV